VDYRKSSKLKAYLKSFNFYNVVSFYVIWYLCILGASFHFEQLAVIVAILLVLIHFSLSRSKLIDFCYLIGFLAIGYGVDKFFLYFSVLSYPEPTLVWNISGVPAWILMLYAGFSTTMNHSLLFVGKRPILSSLLGGIGGAVCYQLAAFRDVVTFPLGWISLAIIGTYWGLFMGLGSPLQRWLSNRMH
jgi:hypothetical protein